MIPPQPHRNKYAFSNSSKAYLVRDTSVRVFTILYHSDLLTTHFPSTREVLARAGIRSLS